MSEWDAILARVTEPAAQLAIFVDHAVADLAQQVASGKLLKPDAVDELVDVARRYDFFGQGEAEIERLVGEQFLLAQHNRDRESDDETARRWERDGEREREREARGNGKADTAPRFKLKYYKDVLMSTARNYLIKGLLPRRGLAVIWGPPKCGKSFIAFDMGMHIALGRPYRDQRVQQGTVVYLAPEGGGGFPARVEAWRQRFLSADEAAGEIPFWLLNDARIDLIADRAELIKAIRDQVAQPPAAIFVDTLNRSLVGDENASADMGRYVRAADELGSEFDCLVGLIHHCGVAGGRPRGHSSLSGADDVEISVAKDGSGLITVTVDLMKDGPVAAPFGCRLESVSAGIDDDGDSITSCVVIPAAAGTRRDSPLTNNQTRFVDILRQAIIECPATPIELGGTDTVPIGVIAVARDVLKNIAWQRDGSTKWKAAKAGRRCRTC